ncbi:TetR family transcriptional regulator [Paramicrobacterium agarici]|uniref:TetR family transcriptional regulator n=1 Tax=Paramicrobacterium agarici TaxID=630514 RepID=A0A2A9DTC7_9MICO|nr:TetR family transcriptional regulator [Microbacterium agarici]PFG29844.1 TetR family transcriptional regulator [Microbacterium agarici]
MATSRPQGHRAGLSRQKIVSGAVELVDHEGAAALSMRRLAKTLGVEAMTLYNYFSGKQAIEDAIVEHVVNATAVPVDSAESWQTVLRHWALGLLNELRQHPGALALIASRPAITTANFAALEEVVRMLHDAGFSSRTALHMVYALAGTVIAHGAVAVEPADHAAVTEALDDAVTPLLADAFAGGVLTADERLAFTIDSLIAGFEARLVS